jgi:hypothetical protein
MPARAGVIIYNNAPGTINGTLGNDFTLDIPVTSVTQASASSWLPRRARSALEDRNLPRNCHNLQCPGRIALAVNPNNVVMAGAHLDSVNAGLVSRITAPVQRGYPRSSRADGQGAAAQPGALCLVGR